MILPITVERAAKALVDSLQLGLNVYTGESTEEMQAPAVIVAAGASEEDFPYSGIYHIALTVNVIYMAADSNASEIDNTASTIFEAFLQDTTPAQLMQLQEGLSVLAIYARNQEFTVSEDALTQTLTLELVAALL